MELKFSKKIKMISHAQRWFQLSSWLFLNRNKEITAIIANYTSIVVCNNFQTVTSTFMGRPVIVLDWRHAWFGPAFRLKEADGSIIHGVDPAALSQFNSRDISSAQKEE